MPDGHLWTLTSEHRVSDGRLRYESCPCGRWRIRLDAAVLAGGTPAGQRLAATATSSGTTRSGGTV